MDFCKGVQYFPGVLRVNKDFVESTHFLKPSSLSQLSQIKVHYKLMNRDLNLTLYHLLDTQLYIT